MNNKKIDEIYIQGLKSMLRACTDSNQKFFNSPFKGEEIQKLINFCAELLKEHEDVLARLRTLEEKQ